MYRLSLCDLMNNMEKVNLSFGNLGNIWTTIESFQLQVLTQRNWLSIL